MKKVYFYSKDLNFHPEFPNHIAIEFEDDLADIMNSDFDRTSRILQKYKKLFLDEIKDVEKKDQE